MPSLNLRLLGGFEAHFASGEPLPPIGRKAQALLAYLALAPGRAQARETLAALLWSDRGEAQARSSLRQALSELRRALAGADPPPLEARGEAVALAAGAVEVDVDVFGRLVDGGEPASLEGAVALYRGDLLDGFAAPDPAFEDWLRDTRRRLHERACAAMARLMTVQLASGEADGALATARRLLDLDPLQESASGPAAGIRPSGRHALPRGARRTDAGAQAVPGLPRAPARRVGRGTGPGDPTAARRDSPAG